MKTAINFLLIKLKQHFSSTVYLEMCTAFGNVHCVFVLEAITSLKFIMCHLDLQILISHHSLICDPRLSLHFTRQLLRNDITLTVISVALCNISSVKMKCSLQF